MLCTVHRNLVHYIAYEAAGSIERNPLSRHFFTSGMDIFSSETNMNCRPRMVDYPGLGAASRITWHGEGKTNVRFPPTEVRASLIGSPPCREPTRCDVLLGRGRGNRRHEGNIRFDSKLPSRFFGKWVWNQPTLLLDLLAADNFNFCLD